MTGIAGSVRFTDWRAQALQLQQNYQLASTAWENAQRAAETDLSLLDAANQAGLAAHAAAREYNRFLDADQSALQLSQAIYHRLNATGGPTLSLTDRAALTAQQQQLTVFASDFQSFEVASGLRPAIPGPVTVDSRIHYADGRTEWDYSLKGQLGRLWDSFTSGAQAVGDTVLSSAPQSFDECRLFLNFVAGPTAGGFLGKVMKAPGHFQGYAGAAGENAWGELVNNAFLGNPVDDTCRVIFPSNEVPEALRLFGAVEGYSPVLGDLMAIDVPVAQLAGAGLAVTLFTSVSSGALDAGTANQWLTGSTGDPSLRVPYAFSPVPTGVQLAAALPVAIDQALWTDGGPMHAVSWPAPVHTFEQHGTVTTWRDTAAYGGTTTTVRQMFDDGSSMTTVERPDGSRTVLSLDAEGAVFRREEHELLSGGGTVSRIYGPGDSLVETATLRPAEGGGSLLVVSRPDGSETRIRRDADGNAIGLPVQIPSYLETVGTVLQDINAIVNALRTGEDIPAVASGIRLLNDLTRHEIPSLNVTAGVAGAVLSVYNLANALEHGDALDQVYAVGSAITAINSAANLLADEIAVEVLDDVAGNIAPALPALGAVLALRNGDYLGAAVQVAAYFVPVVGWIYAGVQLILAANDEPPEAWGVGSFRFAAEGTGLTLDVQGESFGTDRVRLLLEGNGDFPGLRGTLESIIAQAATHNPDEPLGIVPQRLPVLTWREARQTDPGYAVNEIDPLTGAQRHPELRYNDDWTPYNADPTDPLQRRDLLTRLIDSAIDRQAIAPMWEVSTARLQQDGGDPLAGLTEEERAARRGLLAPVDSITGERDPGSFRPVALDLDGDGRITTVADADTSRGIDWDGSGFERQVGWVGDAEGLLFLDRDANGVLSSGRELFSNSLLADAAKGVRSLAWTDANGDGVLNTLDPVFSEMWVWRDADGNALAEAGELASLQELGITELDYSNQRFTRNGQLFALQSPELEASSEGQRVSVVPDGIKVETTDGQVRVYATSVLDASRRPRVATVSDASAVEGGVLDFTVSFNVPGALPTDVTLALQGDTADLVLPMEVSFDGRASFQPVDGGVVSVAAGVQQFAVRVRTLDDAVAETPETIVLTARTPDNAAAVPGTGTLVDNDASVPQLAVSGPAAASESQGTVAYTLTLSQTVDTTVAVNYATVAGSATQGADYAGTSGTLVFQPGETSKTVAVTLLDDDAVEFPESYSLVLSGALGAAIAVPSATTFLQDDDAGDPGDPGALVAADDDLGERFEDFSEQPTTTPATGVVLWSLLLANDRFEGSSEGLSIVSVGNARNVSVSLDEANRAVLVTPRANFTGQASFDYMARSPDGQQRSATAFVTFKPVNDVPEASAELPQRPIYGWAPLVHREVVVSGQHATIRVTLDSGQGQPLYQAYQSVAGREIVQVPVIVGQGVVYEWRETGDTIDTTIPLAYFQDEYATRNANRGPQTAPLAYIDFEMNGKHYRVKAAPQLHAHAEPIASEPNNDGRIVVTDVEGTANWLFEVARAPLYGQLQLDPATGAFTYTGERYVAFDEDGTQVNRNVLTDQHAKADPMFYDTFDVRIVDPGDGSATVRTISVPHYGPHPSPDVQSGSKKPIAIDLDGNGFGFTDVDDSNVFYAVNGDGWRRRIAWNNPGDGFIVFDKNGDGRITDFDELSFVPHHPDGRTDLEGLRAFDSNGDGVYSAADAQWSAFGVWRDADSDGVTDDGELQSLDTLGIQGISLTSDGLFQVIDGQTVHGTGVATLHDGGTLAIADVSLRYRNETLVPGEDGTTRVEPVPTFQPGTTFDGTPDKDLVFGTTGSDTFRLGAGDDVVMDDAGNDGVDAGDGDDVVYTGADVDFVDAGAGNDEVFAGHGNDIVFGGDGDDLLMLEGGNDVAFGGAGHDFIAGGDGNDLISGDAGDDRLFGEGGWDALFGQDGDDELWGLEGNDLLVGGDGNDLLVGGAGDDEMEGGAGDDVYDVDSVNDTIVEHPNQGNDTVRSSVSWTLHDDLENLTLTGGDASSGTGNAGRNVLAGNVAANTLRGLDGDDLLDGGLGADELIGGAGDDTYIVDQAGDRVVELAGEGTDTVRSRVTHGLADHVEHLVLEGMASIDGTGNALDNRITGNEADNVLDGQAGADILIGGHGNDRYVVDHAGDQVIEAFGGGYDTVRVAGLQTYALGEHVEALELGDGSLDGTGNALHNVLTGNAAGNRLDGGYGADILTGLAGDDVYVVDHSDDLVVEAAGGGTDTVLSSVGHALSAHVETLILTTAQDIDGTGNGLDNTIVGNAGNNRIDGAAGADAMLGGAGNDTYAVDHAGDGVVELDGEGVDHVHASIDYVLPQHVEHLTLDGTAMRATGNELDNLLFGNDQANVLDGREGADAMAGGHGDDRYVVNDPGDQVSEAADQGNDTVYASIGHALSPDVENLVLTGADAIDGAGNALRNVLVGNAMANRLSGQAGDDVLAGGAGHDVLDGGDGDDLYLYHQGDGRDVIVDASGDDTLRFGAGITRDSVAGRTIVVDGQGKVFVSLLSVDGTEQSDQGVELTAGDIERFEFADGSTATLSELTITARTLQGDWTANTLTGDRSDDTIMAGGGDDVVYGRTGHDILWGGSGHDRLFGEGGNDRLHGESEHDELWGGAGDDVLDGGSGNDQLVGGTGNDQLLGGVDHDLLDGGAGHDVLNGGSGNDRLYGGAGNDTLDGGTDDDLLAAGDGDDVVNAGSGVNVVVAGSGHDSVTTGTDKDFIDAGAGDDAIFTDSGSDFIAGGRGNDWITTGTDRDLIAFSRGDGADIVVGSGWDRDTLSLGGGIRYADLALRKSGSDLVLEMGADDRITFKDWYLSNGRRSIDLLQVVTVGGDHDPASADRLKNRKVVSFDFAALANRFDQLRAADPSLSQWAVSGELNGYYKAGSDAQAIGGDLAWRYATTRSYGDLDANGVRHQLAGMSGSAWQALTASTLVNPWTALQAGTSLIDDASAGLPSPITPMAPLTGEELVFAAFTASGQRPAWMQQPMAQP